jgi:DNA-binding PadR family transcriptional regulator
VRSFQRGAVRLHVLHHSAREPVHGAWLMTELRKHGHDVSPGTLYPILHSMEAHGLITSEHNVVDGKRLRRYVITDDGRAALDEAKIMLGHLCHELLGHPAPPD